MEIKGLLSICGGLLCKKEVLGKCYEAKIADVEIVIAFPELPVREYENDMDYVGIRNPLIAPEKGNNLSFGNEDDFWGYPMEYPSFNSFVGHVLLVTECEESDASEMAERIYSSVEQWENSFISYCQLCTKQYIKRSHVVSGVRNLKLFSKHGYIGNSCPITIQGNFPSDDGFLSCKQLQEALNFASSGKEFFIEYQMLLSAYKARKNMQNRQAIIDACSAAEICLVNKIKAFCEEKSIDPELFLKKYRSLGERFSLVTAIDGLFPINDYNEVIVKPRNDVAHNREVFPTGTITDNLLTAVEKCLRYYHATYY